MAKRNIVFNEKVHGEETLIYFIQDENTAKKQYYILEAIPDKYQHSQKVLDRINEEVKKYNAENGKQAKLTSLKTKEGEIRWFVEEPSSAIGAFFRAYSVDREIKREQKNIDETNEKSTGSISNKKRFTIISDKAKIKALALILGITLTLGSGIAIFNMNNNSNDSLKNESGIVHVLGGSNTSNKNQSSKNEEIKKPVSSQTPSKTPDESVTPEAPVYIDLDTLTWDTYVNSSGTTMVEVDDMLKIAEACYNNLGIELKTADHDYTYDISKFKPEMYVGEAIQECSLKYVVDYVNKYGCRGMFMIGADATKEANEVSKNLTGKEIISNSKELDDPVEAMMTCMYISVRNYEYCADIVGAENVTPNMVYDCYLFGCGNVRSWLRGCMKNGKYNGNYKPQSYSQKVLYYGECLEPYNKALKQGLTNGEHDSYWKDLHVNRLWKLPDFEAEANGMQQ